ncbi:MAG: transport system ATPase, partial [Candidatus Angelobacter sp.]|nr:transport system ATPase [Candidatus Angelobacter sp.]
MSTNLQHWVDRIRAGDVRALARAISTIEDNRPESRELLKAIFNFTGRARVIGLTGAPGA